MRSSSLNWSASSSGSSQTNVALAGFWIRSGAFMGPLRRKGVAREPPGRGLSRRGTIGVHAAASNPVRRVGNHRRRLDLDAGGILDQRLDLDGGHRRKMPADDFTVHRAQRAIAADVFALVDDVPR